MILSRKRKKNVHMSMVKPLILYELFKDIIKFSKKLWSRRRKLYPGYFFVYPMLNQSIKWRSDYIIINRNIYKLRKKYRRFAR